MMDPVALDPYEQQLLAVFNRYDYDNVGSLDEGGLKELCQTLQLQEQGTELINSLLSEPSKSRIKFLEFKDALLTLLGNMQNSHNEQASKSENKGSPEREVSPKYIYGSKKYGRRSRPKTDLNLDEQNDLNYLNTGIKNKETTVQRSNSEVCHSKKRKTNFKLKRCTSLPSREDSNPFQGEFPNSDSFENENVPIYTEKMLSKAWKSLGVGKDGYLNQSELILVCDAIGLHNLASAVIRQLSHKSNLDYNQKISFQELLEALKHDETWAYLLNSTEPSIQPHSIHLATSSFPDSQTFQYISLGPDGNGVISSDTIIDMWESVGITAPKELLHDLGFNSQQIKIAELASVLDTGLKSLHESPESYTNPHISLLQANLTLYQSEIKCLKHVMDQLNEEKDKLRNDLVEANNRATLLAQDVDDHHQKIQESTRNQVKLLEQRHSEILKNLSKKFSEEKEELREFNYSLEQKISNLEQESSKLRNDLTTAKKYLSTVETENSQLSCKIADLHEAKEMLQERVIILENECRKYNELDHENIKPLLEKLSRLELENGRLRDQGDEMGAEIEALNSEISSLRSREESNVSDDIPCNTLDESMENAENLSLLCGSGAKRRNDGSPSKDVSLYNSNLSLSSPRLGKIRKLPNCSEERPTSSESGFSTEIEYSDNSSYFSPTATWDKNELKRLQTKILLLEQILQQHDIAVPSDEDLETVWSNVSNVAQLKNRVKCLENIIGEIKHEFQKFTIKDRDFNHMIEKISKMIVQDDLLGSKVYELESKERIFVDAGMSTENEETTKFETEKMKLEEQNKELTTKCTELENCIDLLRNEYEKCEDYWANKLDEERQIFELEQAQSNEKFAELFKKMSEYEEQYAQQDSRLPTIVESYNLEQQFTDLEEEYENYKTEVEGVILGKGEEIAFLKRKLTELAVEKKKTTDAGLQVDNLNEYVITADKMMHLSSVVVEYTSFLPEESLPDDWKKTDHSLGCNGVGYHSAYRSEGQDTPDSGNNCESEIQAMSWPNASDDIQTSLFPSTSSSPTEKRTAPCRPRRTRKHERDANQYKKNHSVGSKGSVSDGTSKENHIPTLLNMIQNLADKKMFLEQRCRSLLLAVRKQRAIIETKSRETRYDQKEFQYIVKQSHEEMDRYMRTCKELSDKLMKTDLLVKELYVENSYLIANVQRLEQQNHFFAQCSTNNSL